MNSLSPDLPPLPQVSRRDVTCVARHIALEEPKHGGDNQVLLRLWPADCHEEGSALYWIHSEHLGSTVLVTDDQDPGEEVGRQKYYPYGSNRGQSGSIPTDYLFTGQKWDNPIGLYFYNARYYDPALGRFIQADTIVPEPCDCLYSACPSLLERGPSLAYRRYSSRVTITGGERVALESGSSSNSCSAFR